MKDHAQSHQPTMSESIGSDRHSALSIGNAVYEPLGHTLSEFEPIATISAIAGLLTVSAYQSANIRLEMLLHLAVAYCNGERAPKRTHLSNWVNEVLAELPARRMEDPPEDVFISNIVSSAGNYRIFEGTWELNDAYLQDLISCLEQTKWGDSHPRLNHRVFALLRLSEALAQRAGVERWATTSITIPTDIIVKTAPEPRSIGRRVRFSESDLAKIGIAPEHLARFVFLHDDRAKLLEEELTHTTLQRHPLILFGADIIVAYPTAISPAIRHFVLEWAAENEELENLGRTLRYIQRGQVFGHNLHTLVKADLHEPPPVPQLLHSPPASLPVDDTVVPFDEDKLAHIVLLHDDLNAIRLEGVGSTARLERKTGQAFAEYLSAVAARLSQNSVMGMTLLVSGGLGRGAALQFTAFPPNWALVPVSLHDFSMFANSNEASLLRIWKLDKARGELEDNGIFIMDMNGLLNIYSYWRSLDFHLVPATFPYPQEHGMIAIGTNYIYDFRLEERRKHDVHAAVFDDFGHMLPVRRIHREAFFEALRHRPVFVADSLLEEGMLLGVVQHSKMSLWMWASRSGLPGEAVGFLYRIWDATLSWFDRLLPKLFGGSKSSYAPVHVRLEMDPSVWNKITSDEEDEPARPNAYIDFEQRQITVRLPFGFRSLLHRAANDGERALLEEIAFAILAVIHPNEDHRTRCQSAVAEVMGGSDARSIHVFNTVRPADFFLTEDVRLPRLLQKEDIAAWDLGLAWRGRTQEDLRSISSEIPRSDETVDSEVDPREQSIVIVGRDACTSIFNDVVDGIWHALHQRLGEINGLSLISTLLENIESIFQDRVHWYRTARAVTALHSVYEDAELVAANRESARAQASGSARVLIEMAISTCPPAEGRNASMTDVDWLVSGVYTLLNVASDSDAVRGGLAEAHLEILPSGAMNRRYGDLIQIVNRFGTETHVSRYREGAASYDSLFERRAEESAEPDPEWLTRPAFVHAYTEEYGITPARLMNGIGELLDIAHEGGSVVAHVTRGEIALKLREQRSFSEDEIAAFLSTLCLIPRERWDLTPTGYKKRDWEPWRFRRRLSLVARPLVSVGQQPDAVVMYGVNQLSSSLSYAIESIRSAWLPDEYFRTVAMRRYRGSVVDAEGHAFNLEVGRALEDLGWKVRTEVQMTSLGAGVALGDLDVVCWRANDSRLLLIECKRLQPTRTIGEIVDQLNRFRGEAGDSLGKHLRRVEFVRANIDVVRNYLGAFSSSVEVSPYLVTSAEVPLSFATHLALASDRILSRERLADVLGASRKAAKKSRRRK